MADAFQSSRKGLSSPSDLFAAISPDSAADLPGGLTRALYVGTGGDLIVHGRDGLAVTFKDVPSGALLPLRVARVLATSTAADMVALY